MRQQPGSELGAYKLAREDGRPSIQAGGAVGYNADVVVNMGEVRMVFFVNTGVVEKRLYSWVVVNFGIVKMWLL